MTIIQPGKLPETGIYNGQCERCKCIVECTQKETFVAELNKEDIRLIRFPTPGCVIRIFL